MTKLVAPLVLASASPRRRQLLEQLGFRFDVVVPDIDESEHKGETPIDYVLRLAKEKARVGASMIAKDDACIVAADTTVVIDNHILGKPHDDQEGAKMLSQLAGRTHEVLTGIACSYHNKLDAKAVVTRVTFRQLDPTSIEHYVASGEGRDKAGSYAAQGLGTGLIESIEGSYTNVVGLPTAQLLDMMHETGVLRTWP